MLDCLRYMMNPYGPPPLDQDHPSLIMVNAMMHATKMQQMLTKMLLDRGVKRLHDFTLSVDFTIREATLSYAFHVRVFRKNDRTPKAPVYSYWAATRNELVDDQNIIALLVLYNS